MRWALISGGKVANVVEAEAVPTIPGQWIECGNAGPGWAYDGSAFSNPSAPEAVSTRHITRLAFLNRFTDAEAIAIDLASIGATVPAASMRRYQSKVSNALFINLDLPELRAGVQALEAAGLLAAGRAAQILDAPILDSERAPA